jgi:spore germination cell wall hydrolase CwlJ-like protein
LHTAKKYFLAAFSYIVYCLLIITCYNTINNNFKQDKKMRRALIFISVALTSVSVFASPNNHIAQVKEKPDWDLSMIQQKPDWDLSKVEYAKHDKHVKCLAQNIYHEARGDSTKGQIAVAQVVINRTKNDAYPDDVCKVVWDKSQFSWTLDKSLWKIDDIKSYEKAKKIASEVLKGKHEDITNGATHYYEPTVVDPYWSDQGINKKRIGSHLFMRMKSGGA